MEKRIIVLAEKIRSQRATTWVKKYILSILVYIPLIMYRLLSTDVLRIVIITG